MTATSDHDVPFTDDELAFWRKRLAMGDVIDPTVLPHRLLATIDALTESLNAARVVAERPDGPTPLFTGIVMQTVNRDGDPWVAIHPDGDLPKGLLRREVVVLAAPTEEASSDAS